MEAGAPITTTAEQLRDGRHERVDRSKAAILAAAREFMQAGAFQAPLTAIAKRAGLSVRSCFQHYGDAERLRMAALECPLTRASILTAVCGQDASMPVYVAERIVRAVVLGRAKV